MDRETDSFIVHSAIARLQLAARSTGIHGAIVTVGAIDGGSRVGRDSGVWIRKRALAIRVRQWHVLLCRRPALPICGDQLLLP